MSGFTNTAYDYAEKAVENISTAGEEKLSVNVRVLLANDAIGKVSDDEIAKKLQAKVVSLIGPAFKAEAENLVIQLEKAVKEGVKPTDLLASAKNAIDKAKFTDENVDELKARVEKAESNIK